MTTSSKNEKTRKRDMENSLSEMASLKESLGEAYLHFEEATDPDVLDACVYEINALRSRWNAAYKHYRIKFWP